MNFHNLGLILAHSPILWLATVNIVILGVVLSERLLFWLSYRKQGWAMFSERKQQVDTTTWRLVGREPDNRKALHQAFPIIGKFQTILLILGGLLILLGLVSFSKSMTTGLQALEAISPEMRAEYKKMMELEALISLLFCSIPGMVSLVSWMASRLISRHILDQISTALRTGQLT